MVCMRYFFLAVLLLQIPQLAKASQISRGTLVYFENQETAKSSSRSALSGHWVGKVKESLENDLVEILPTSHDSWTYEGATVFKQRSDLSPQVKEYGGISTGNLVTLKDGSGSKGYVLEIFANGMARVDWISLHSKTTVPNFLLADQIKNHPREWSVGQTVLVTQEIRAFDLRSNERDNEGHVTRSTSKYGISNLSLGFIPYVGKITEISSVIPEGGLGDREITIMLEKENGVDLKKPKPRIVKARMLSPEVMSNSDQQVVLNKSDPANYSSDRGIKPYEFRGKVERLFENGVAEIRWDTKNGKKYGKKNLDYLPAQTLNRPLNPDVSKYPGKNVLEKSSENYLAIASIERALKKPDSSYLYELDRLVYSRANKVCIARGFKGLLGEPLLDDLKNHDNKPLIAADAGGDIFEIQDYPVPPWEFKIRSARNALTMAGWGTLAGGFVGSGVGVGLFLQVGATAAAVGSGIGVGLLAAPFLAIGAVEGYRHLKPTPLEKAKSRLLGKKSIHKKFAMFTEKVPTKVFSALFCTNHSSEISHPDPFPPMNVNLAAHFKEIAQATQAHSKQLGQLYEAPDGSSDDETFYDALESPSEEGEHFYDALESQPAEEERFYDALECPSEDPGCSKKTKAREKTRKKVHFK